MSSIAAEITSTLQFGSIEKNPSVKHDLNPSSVASRKVPVALYPNDDISDVYDDEIPISALRPLPRKQNLPPLPDLRFEQSYLRSIAKADTHWGVFWITLKDQVVFPLLQGTLWELALCGWRFWGVSTRVAGNSTGSKIRRWLVDNGFVRR